MKTPERIYQLALSLWLRIVDKRGGPPGVPGPAGVGKPWDENEALLTAAERLLTEVANKLPVRRFFNPNPPPSLKTFYNETLGEPYPLPPPPPPAPLRHSEFPYMPRREL